MRLVEAGADERPRIERLLQDSDLPTDDLDASPVRLFAGYDDGQFVGVGGLERYGPDALLRSVAVLDALRGNGYGTAIYREIEARAGEDGVERLYLLTETAAPFFAEVGFEAVDRDEAPDSIRDTAEFRELCSSEATCMRKVVG